MTRRLWSLGVGAWLACGITLAADGKPDFTGFWKMNAEKSDFGMMPKPDKYETTVDHKDPQLKVKTVQAGQMGERTTESSYKTDGTESINKLPGMGGGEVEIKSIVAWEGKVLNVKSKLEVQGNEINFLQKWSLSEDGKTLTLDVTVNSPQGDLQMKQVLDKQEAAAQ